MRSVLPILVSVLSACQVCAIACLDKNDTADTSDTAALLDGCTEVVIECPYRSWAEEDYDTATCTEPDAYVCMDNVLGTPQQESCPDNDPTHPECGGRDAAIEMRGDQVCAACTSLDGDVYQGHPTYTGECGDKCDCVDQAEPPWVFIRAVVCK